MLALWPSNKACKAVEKENGLPAVIEGCTVIFLVLEGKTIFSARMNFIIIVPSYCYPLLTKQKGEKMKWYYETVRVGKDC